MVLRYGRRGPVAGSVLFDRKIAVGQKCCGPHFGFAFSAVFAHFAVSVVTKKIQHVINIAHLLSQAYAVREPFIPWIWFNAPEHFHIDIISFKFFSKSLGNLLNNIWRFDVI